MKTQYFKCTLKTDIVVNASLATEGNMTTLDYIPGSNFLGVVAGKLYKENKLSKTELYDVFHSDKVSFGDALISRNEAVSYTIPFSLFQDKLNKGLGKENNKTWVHHLLGDNRPENESGYIQLKQQRGGFLNKNKDYIKSVEKKFTLKSAYNRDERRSAEGKMFGFESIVKGQEFVFSIIFEDDKYFDLVSDAVIGDKRIGKSKTAQYGKVSIKKIDNIDIFESKPSEGAQLVIYAESNLCFLNDKGQSTFQPRLSEFGLVGYDDKLINWNKSQIRTYSYSPWNGIRNTTNTQRDTIAKGSVIVVDVKDVDIYKLKTQVGEYTAEGLGRVIYNPEFLDADEKGVWNYGLKGKDKKKKTNSIKQDDIKTSTSLGTFLHKKLNIEANELNIGKAVIKVLETNTILKSDKIKPSQWGAIRTKATNASSIDGLLKELFTPKIGYLTHGVAAERIWDKNRGNRRIALEKVINENKELGTKFVARLAADMAKLNKEGNK